MKNKVVSWRNLGFVVFMLILLLIVINFGNITGKMIAETDSGLVIDIPNVVKSRGVMEIKIIPDKKTKKGYYPEDIDIIEENKMVVGSAKIICDSTYYCKKEGKTNYVLPRVAFIDVRKGPMSIVTCYN